MKGPEAEIGIFGGSGFYSFLDKAQEVALETPFGPPSDDIVVGELGRRRIAFLARHGRKHTIPPHRINYRANLWAFKDLGVERVISPCAVGSLNRQIIPGDFVICDQIVDRTTGRMDTFYDGPETTHVAFADPYCPELSPLAARIARDQGIRAHDRGTMVVVQGPRFSTRAESTFYSQQGWEVIGMTQYPEVVLARELEMCFLNISLVTDYDAGAESTEAVTVTNVIEVLEANNQRLRGLLFALIKKIPKERSCPCGSALQTARL